MDFSRDTDLHFDTQCEDAPLGQNCEWFSLDSALSPHTQPGDKAHLFFSSIFYHLIVLLPGGASYVVSGASCSNLLLTIFFDNGPLFVPLRLWWPPPPLLTSYAVTKSIAGGNSFMARTHVLTICPCSVPPSLRLVLYCAREMVVIWIACPTLVCRRGHCGRCCRHHAAGCDWAWRGWQLG